jgi:hypothetical protein
MNFMDEETCKAKGMNGEHRTLIITYEFTEMSFYED